MTPYMKALSQNNSYWSESVHKLKVKKKITVYIDSNTEILVSIFSSLELLTDLVMDSTDRNEGTGFLGAAQSP